jgi:hypothetical protein
LKQLFGGSRRPSARRVSRSNEAQYKKGAAAQIDIFKRPSCANQYGPPSANDPAALTVTGEGALIAAGAMIKSALGIEVFYCG